MKRKILISFILVSIAWNEKSLSADPPAENAVEKTEVAVEPKAADNAIPIQKRIGRPKTYELNGESSSFIGDPDNIDPLPVNRENLKEDDEPVLEDIRQVLDAKPKAKKTAKKKRKSKGDSLSDLDDASIEKRFHSIYEKYNSSPTSPEAWSKAAEGRASEEYTVQKGDTLWTISKTFFGNSEYWPKIWAINRQGITNPHQIVPGLKIHFYPGSDEAEPTLAVGETTAEAAPTSNIIRKKVGGGAISVLDGDDVEQIEIDLGPPAVEQQPTNIPDSLPLYRNDLLFSEPKETKIDLRKPPVIPSNFDSDIILSDIAVLSEVKISLDSISNQSCTADQVIKGIRFVRGQHPEYAVLERIDRFEVEKDKYIYVYKIVGNAKPYKEDSVILTDCNSILSTDIYLVKKENLPLLKTRKLTYTPKASLIGGTSVNKQTLFAFHQYAYIDLGNLPIENGQRVDIKSQITDRVIGEAQIIEKFGSYAVGVITDVAEKIERGDLLVLKK